MCSAPEKHSEPLPTQGEVSRPAVDPPEDFEFLSALSESELDLLVSLKELAIQRAKNAGHWDLIEVFDLRTLRALSFIVVEYLKEWIRTTSASPNSAEMLKQLSRCNLVSKNHNHEGFMTCNKDIQALSSATSKRKRLWDSLCDEQCLSYKKQKTSELNS